MSLPPDPEEMNDDRASWALVGLKAFQELTGSDDDTAVYDLICDLHHLLDRQPEVYGVFGEELERAERCYLAETTE